MVRNTLVNFQRAELPVAGQFSTSGNNLEIVTPHYRGAHAAAKARSGFTRYRAAGARVGGSGGSGRGGRGRYARLAEELLP